MFAAKNELLTRPSGYQISRSLRFRSSASAYLSRTPSTTSGSSSQIYTWSGWVKLGYFNTGYLISATGNSGYRMTSLMLRGLGGSGALEFEHFDGTTTYNLTTSAVFRDPSAWYHIVIAVDTPQATNTNRTKIYVNGVQQTVTGTYLGLSATTYINTANVQSIGRANNANAGSSGYFDGYLAEVNFIDGQALTPSSFGAFDTNGVWQPIACTVSDYGKNGFYLPFSDSANIFNDKAAIATNHSAANNWTASGLQTTSSTLTTYDWMLDSPTNYADGGNGRGNYCVLNPLNKAPSDVSISSGNLEASSSFTGDHRCFASTFQVTSGKWYWEVQYATGTISSGSDIVGVFNLPVPDTANNRRPADSINNGIGIRQDGQYESDNTTASYFGSSIAVGDVIGVALDADAGTIRFNVNGGSLGATLTFVSAGGVYTPGGDIRASSGTPKTIHNFGQRPFTYTPPSGFSALNTQNLPTPTIANGAQYMAATTYTGNGSTQTITNGGNNNAGTTFQPDFVWVKQRSGVARSHRLEDAVRGATKALYSDLTDAETTEANSITAFNLNGFSIGSQNGVNNTSETYIGWQWKGGNGTVSNTSGSITSTVSANVAAGFSIVTWTADGSLNNQVGHGLNVAPVLVIYKDRDAVNDWWTLSTITGSYQYIRLNATAGFNAQTGVTISSTTIPNYNFTSTHKMVAYCFAPVSGYSAAFSYTGNGSADGPMVYLGFRPRFILRKRSDAVSNWLIMDTSRNTYNAANYGLFPDLSDAENSFPALDILSNGFKVRGTGSAENTSGGTYIGFAFAENPFKTSRAR